MNLFKRIAQRAKAIRSTSNDLGMTTAEYAVGTVAAVAFAVVLFKVVQSAAVRGALTSIVTGALHVHM
jgi:ABC-type polysaccharide transport system permease subunit